MKKINSQPLLLFDGICNLCNSSVQFIISHDRQKKFTFASLQSDAAKEILLQFDTKYFNLDSIILIYNDKIYSKSAAIIRVGMLLGKGFSFSVIFYIIPRFIRDWMYDFIAKNRYKWFGKKESCMLPNKDLKNRFL